MKREKYKINKNNTRQKYKYRGELTPKRSVDRSPLIICVCKRQRQTKVVSTRCGIGSDTEKEQLCVFSGGDCQSSRCCFSSPWQATNYDERQQSERLPWQHNHHQQSCSWCPRKEPAKVGRRGDHSWAEAPGSGGGSLRALAPIQLTRAHPPPAFKSLYFNLLKQIGPADMWVQSPRLTHKINTGAQGQGQNPHPQGAGITAGLVWALGGVGWKKETIHFSECRARRRRRTDGGILCLSQWWMEQTGAVQSLDCPLPEPQPPPPLRAAADTGNRGRRGAALRRCLLMSRERDQRCLKIPSIGVCLHTRECARWWKLINGSLRVRLHHCG